MKLAAMPHTQVSSFWHKSSAEILWQACKWLVSAMHDEMDEMNQNQNQRNHNVVGSGALAANERPWEEAC